MRMSFKYWPQLSSCTTLTSNSAEILPNMSHTHPSIYLTRGTFVGVPLFQLYQIVKSSRDDSEWGLKGRKVSMTVDYVLR